ncbi:ECF RNA polymerase sigma factor RpoE [termite gut metagenome]|uniref:ECF RNA polymerase sigma factor RpoE n=1 Tax=termite gut metagenome TaxID=433724 RepID=A0A5J4RJ91_9ZZZZ
MEQNNDYKYIEKLAQNDDHDAFRFLFLKYFPKLKFFITHLVKSETIAEELSQDIFIRIWENREKLTVIQSLNSYLYRMAKNAAINYLNRKYVEENYVLNYNQYDEPSVEETFQAKEMELLVQLVVERMPSQRKKIFEMSRVENLKNEEIAKKLNISKKTVENHLNFALKEIRKAISLSVFFFF